MSLFHPSVPPHIAAGYQYWRVRFDSTPYYSSQWHAVTEVEYFTAAGKIAYGTLASYTLVGQVSNNSSNTYKAYDGVTATGQSACATTSPEDGHWAFGLDFVSNTDITQIIVYGPNDYGIHYNWNTNMYLEYSENASSWTTAASDTDGIGTSTSNVVTLTV